MKYSIYKLPDDNGVAPKTPITQLLIDLENDDELSIGMKLHYALRIANELNISRTDIISAKNKISVDLDYISSIILTDQENQLRKCKDWLFHGR